MSSYRVNDYSTLVGTGSQSTATSYRRRVTYTNGVVGAWIGPINGTSVTRRRAKSPTVAGGVDPFTGWRKATPYTRYVLQGDHTSEFTWRNRALDGSEHDYKITNPFQGLGFSMKDGGKISGYNVNIDVNLVERSKAEAYDSLLQTKVNLGQAAAELAETLAWFSSLVSRLMWAIRVVRDAIRGKISRFVAHKRLWENPNRIYPNTRIRNNRWKDVAGDPMAVRYRLEQHRHWWNSEAYERWYRKTSRANRRKFRPTRTGSSAWLEYQYALMPLIYDLYGAAALLSEGLRGDNHLFSVQRTITGQCDPGRFLSSSAGAYNVSGNVMESARTVFTARYRTSSLGAQTELGLNNPWSIAWELVPFSFVVDWVLPVGKVLSSITAPLGVTFVDGYTSKILRGRVTGYLHNSGRGFRISGTLPTASVKIMAFQRITYLSWPWVMPYMKSPFNSNHVVTALALLRQLT